MESTEMAVTQLTQPWKASGEMFRGVTVRSEYDHMLRPLHSPDLGFKTERVLWVSLLETLAQ